MLTSSVPSAAPWWMLASRGLLFLAFQLLIAGALALGGSPSAWEDSAGWWTLSALFANLVSIGLLRRLLRGEGKRFFDFFCFSRRTLWQDIGLALLVFALAGPVSTLPNLGLATLLFGSSEAVFPLMFRPLPLWAGLLSILFPLTVAFAELPTYFGYCMPRLEQRLGSGWLAWGLACLFLALQHVTLPLILDWRFVAWRAGMFLPLALLLGLALKLRPRLFPYLMAGHALLDMITVVMILTL